MNVIALIPSYCPDEHLIPLEARLKQLGMNICLVDDGSPNDYEGIFRNSEVYADVLHQRPNKGKGAALKYGLRFIRDHYGKDCTIVTLDSDGQHTVEDAERCAEEASFHPGSLILGARDTENRNVPFHNRFGNQLTASLFYLSTGANLKDTQTGLRAFTGGLLDFMINIDGMRYEYEMNVLLKCAHSDIPMREVEIQTIYGTCSKASHFHILRDSFLIYKQLFHFAASSLVSFLIDYSMFALLTLCLPVLSANILARLISAFCNYEINRKAVFHDERSRSTSLLKYALLATGILTVNTLLLNLFVNQFGVNEYLAKLIVEMLLFSISWTVQKCVIFPDGKQIAQ